MYQQINISRLLLISVKNLIIVLFFTIVVHANTTDNARTFTPLSGELPPLLKAENSPYIVEADIYVSPGATVTIENGVVILFSNFTGLHIQGTLYVNGTRDKPIIFTSINDTLFNSDVSTNAAPYDWNGIDIYENAIGTNFKYCVLQYSVYGIRSQTEHFHINNIRFLQNGKSNITIKGNAIDVSDAPFSYNSNISENKLVPSPVSVSKNVTDTAIHKNKHMFRYLLRYSGAICALGGLAAAAFLSQEYFNAQDNYKNISQVNNHNMQNYTSKDWENARNRYRQASMIEGICCSIGTLGLITFGVSFTF